MVEYTTWVDVAFSKCGGPSDGGIDLETIGQLWTEHKDTLQNATRSEAADLLNCP